MRLCIPLLASVLASGLAAAQTPDPAYEPLTKAYEALRTRSYDDAIALFLKAIEAAPSRPAVRKDLAYTYLKIGENGAARDQFREAMLLDPKDFHVALEYAFLCNETKEQAQARRVFDHVRQAGDPESRATAERASQNIDRPLAESIARWTKAIHLGAAFSITSARPATPNPAPPPSAPFRTSTAPWPKASPAGPRPSNWAPTISAPTSNSPPSPNSAMNWISPPNIMKRPGA